MQRNCVIIGIGNPDCGDDAAGRIVARQLNMKHAAGTRVVEHCGEAAGLVECLSSARAAYIIDSSVTGQPPGAINRLNVAAKALPRGALGCSTHGVGLAEAIELARALGRLPPRCVVYAIEGRRYEVGAALSPEVAAAAEKVVMLIQDELAKCEAV